MVNFYCDVSHDVVSDERAILLAPEELILRHDYQIREIFFV